METHSTVSCIYNQIAVPFVLFTVPLISDVWIPDPLHDHQFSEEWRVIHGLSNVILHEELCSRCWVFRIARTVSREELGVGLLMASLFLL